MLPNELKFLLCSLQKYIFQLYTLQSHQMEERHSKICHRQHSSCCQNSYAFQVETRFTSTHFLLETCIFAYSLDFAGTPSYYNKSYN